MNLPSNYLSQHPELVPPSGGYPVPPTFGYAEFVGFSFYVKRRLIRDMPQQQLSSLLRREAFLPALGAFEVQAYMHYTKWGAGRSVSHTRRIKLPVRVLPNGGVVLTIDPKTGAIPDAVRKSRISVASLAKPGGNRSSSRHPRRSSRPNPEVRTRTYLRITESYSPSASNLNSQAAGYNSYVRDWGSINTPGYGRLRSNRLPVNPGSSRIVEVQDGPGVFLNHIPSSGNGFNLFTSFTEVYPVPNDPFTHVPGSEFKALRKLIDNAQIGIEANLAQDFAQIGQTINLITHTCKRLTGAITSLRRGNIPGAIKSLWQGKAPKTRGSGPRPTKSLADNWLELQYGWKPLLQDIHGAFESLAQLSVGDPFARRVTGTAEVEYSDASPIGHRTHAPTVAGAHYFWARTRCKYVLRYKVDDHLQQFLHQTGFANPINLGWEILPFSFVVDWFSPIGPFLETLTAWNGVTFVDGSVTLFTRRRAQSVVNFFGQVPTAPGQLFDEKAKFVRETIQWERGKLTTFPTAYLPSGFKNGLSSLTHATNALALLRAGFSGHVDRRSRI